MISAAAASVADAGLRAIEEATLNAAQPPEQLLVDGWWLRMSAGKARRARSVQPLAAGLLPLDDKLAQILPLYERRGLTPLLRITPWSQPADLDDQLAARGWTVVEPSIAMTRPLPTPDGDCDDASLPARLSLREVDAAALARHAGSMRALSAAAIDAQITRMQASPLADATVCLLAFDGDQAAAAGQVICERGLAGLYDIVVAPAWRRRGLAAALVHALLRAAVERFAAHTAYLQVGEANAAARRLYARLGFADRYAYWYRRPAHHAGD